MSGYHPAYALIEIGFAVATIITLPVTIPAVAIYMAYRGVQEAIKYFQGEPTPPATSSPRLFKPENPNEEPRTESNTLNPAL